MVVLLLKNPQKYSDNVSACTLCLSCDNVCPSKVGPGSQIYEWRQSLEKLGKAGEPYEGIGRGIVGIEKEGYTIAIRRRKGMVCNV